jgi:hypothetical protein
MHGGVLTCQGGVNGRFDGGVVEVGVSSMICRRRYGWHVTRSDSGSVALGNLGGVRCSNGGRGGGQRGLVWCRVGRGLYLWRPWLLFENRVVA